MTNDGVWPFPAARLELYSVAGTDSKQSLSESK